ncbi:MAG: hypothetical protein IAI50_02270 [Candidatus Eremiobacteraeota bacterium]|nr:hypothetical protein [Candidatus Eremiobacteraeota bacterium]
MSSPAAVEGHFSATLSVRDRRLAGRLEGFGDIVFGFAVSQCGLQLPMANGHVDLARVTGLLLYFATFALLASLWLTYHRLLAGPYKPTRIDLCIAFSYLALVSLMPYALYSVSHETESAAQARTAVAEYAILFAAMMGLAALLSLRNLRRGWWHIDEEDRDLLWLAVARRTMLCTLMLCAVPVDLMYGPAIGSIPFLFIFIGLRVVRMRFSHAPRPALLRLQSPVGGALL